VLLLRTTTVGTDPWLATTTTTTTTTTTISLSLSLSLGLSLLITTSQRCCLAFSARCWHHSRRRWRHCHRRRRWHCSACARRSRICWRWHASRLRLTR
jgi:hypothetical protein